MDNTVTTNNIGQSSMLVWWMSDILPPPPGWFPTPKRPTRLRVAPVNYRVRKPHPDATGDAPDTSKYDIECPNCGLKIEVDPEDQ